MKTCTSATAITLCKDADATNFYYKTAQGCKSYARTSNCLTVTDPVDANANIITCASCIVGYYLSAGACKSPLDAMFYHDTEITTDTAKLAAINVITPGTVANAITEWTCKPGYYKIKNAATTGTVGHTNDGAYLNKCRACPDGCATCERHDATAGANLDCLTKITGANANKYFIDGKSIIRKCADATWYKDTSNSGT